MTDVIERTEWVSGVRQLDPGDRVIGGVNTPINLPLIALASRTQWLKTELASAVQSIGSSKADKAVQMIAGNGLTGGGDLSANRTLTLGTPGQITAGSTNSATATSHTHAIDTATTARRGIVQLNDTLTSTAADQALTAAQGKALADAKADKAVQMVAGNGLSGGGDLSASRTLALGTPGQITAGSTNSTSATSHTHAIDSATTARPGIVQLNDTLTSTATDQALTAARGFELSQDRMRCRAPGPVADDPDTTASSFMLTTHANKPPGSGGYCYIMTWFYSSFTSSRWQLAVDYVASATAPRMWVRSGYSTPTTWTAWQQIDGADWAQIRARPSNIKAYAADAVNQTELAAAIGNLVNGAPGALDTLRELATAMGNDPNFAATMANQLAQTVKLTGDQTVAGVKTYSDQLRISGARTMTEFAGWREAVNFIGAHAAIMLNSEYGIGLHQPQQTLVLLDAVNKRVGLTYSYAAQTLTVAGDGRFGGISVAALNSGKADKTAQVVAGNGLSGGGDLSANRTLALGTPGQITAASTNAVQAASHTHAIDTATTTRRGIVQLNDTLTSTATDQALTAAQGKVLADTGKAGVLAAAPPGQIAFLAGAGVPAGWLKANGAAVSRTTYAALYAAIGTRYGAGNGSSTFNLPDLRGEFVRGWDDARGVDSGRGLGSAQSDAIRNIVASVAQLNDRVTNGSVSGAFAGGVSEISSGAGLNNGGTGRTLTFDASRVVPTAAENRPRNIALLACIKI